MLILHGVITQKTSTWIFTAVKTSNLVVVVIIIVVAIIIIIIIIIIDGFL